MPFDDTQRHALNHVDFLVEQGCNREDTEQQLNHSGFYKTPATISELLAYYDDAIFAQELAREEDTLAALRQTKHIVESGVGRKRVDDAKASSDVARSVSLQHNVDETLVLPVKKTCAHGQRRKKLVTKGAEVADGQSM